nr:hypothetical protein CFP56_17142 [Quercus suber]
MMRGLEASVKHLKIRLETEANSLKKFKEFGQTLCQEVIELKAKLGRVNHQYDELMKENANLKSEVVALHKHMDKIRLNTPTTPTAKPILDNVETDYEVLVIDEPRDVADDPKDP